MASASCAALVTARVGAHHQQAQQRHRRRPQECVNHQQDDGDGDVRRPARHDAIMGGYAGAQAGVKPYTWPSLVAVTTRRSLAIDTPTGYPVAAGIG